MPTITAKGGEDFTVLPKDSIVVVQVNSTKVEDVPGKDGKDSWEKLDFEFTIDHVPMDEYGDAQGQKIWGGVPFRLTDHPDNRLKQWVEALLGIEVAKGFELDTDMLLGRQARAIVDNYPRKAGGTAHKVGALLPLVDPGQAQAAAAFQQPAQPAPQPAPPATSDVPF